MLPKPNLATEVGAAAETGEQAPSRERPAAAIAVMASVDPVAAEIPAQPAPAQVGATNHPPQRPQHQRGQQPVRQRAKRRPHKPPRHAAALSAGAQTMCAAQMSAETTATIAATVAIAVIALAITVASVTFGVATTSSTSMMATITAIAIGCAPKPVKPAVATGARATANVANSTNAAQKNRAAKDDL
jgi:hypothetical protein